MQTQHVTYKRFGLLMKEYERNRLTNVFHTVSLNKTFCKPCNNKFQWENLLGLLISEHIISQLRKYTLLQINTAIPTLHSTMRSRSTDEINGPTMFDFIVLTSFETELSPFEKLRVHCMLGLYLLHFKLWKFVNLYLYALTIQIPLRTVTITNKSPTQ